LIQGLQHPSLLQSYLIQHLNHPSLLWLLPDNSFKSFLMHRLHHPLLSDESLAPSIVPSNVPDQPFAPYIAPSIAQYDLFIMCERYNEQIELSNRRSEG